MRFCKSSLWGQWLHFVDATQLYKRAQVFLGEGMLLQGKQQPHNAK